jgi:hypothetical protein
MSINSTRRRRRRIGIVLAIVLIAALCLDMARLVKPSGIAAVSCTPILFRKASTESQFIEGAKGAIARESERNDLPGLLVAAIVVDHRRQLTPYRTFTDCFGSALGKDLSLGPAQMRMSTAAQLDGQSFSRMSATAHRNLRAMLLETDTNVSYEARELRALLERKHRSPGISASALLNSPSTMALLVTEYRSGRMSTAEENSPVGANALRTLRLLQDDALAPFRPPDLDLARTQVEVEAYFSAIRCKSGKSNRACAREAPEDASGRSSACVVKRGCNVGTARLCVAAARAGISARPQAISVQARSMPARPRAGWPAAGR